MQKKAVFLIVFLFMVTGMWYLNSESRLKEFGTLYETYTECSNSSGKILHSDDGLRKTCFLKVGESVRVNGDISYRKILKDLNARLVFTESISEGTSYYAYSSLLKTKTQIKGKSVNLHIFVGKNSTVVGTPMILGSF